MEAKNEKVIYVANIPKRVFKGAISNKFKTLEEKLKKLPINRSLVETYSEQKDANVRAYCIRNHFKIFKMNNAEVKVAVRTNNENHNVYIWKVKE
jgi:hypothetical protein